jgi:RimJ/RimL family protein N-acetyltransferase
VVVKAARLSSPPVFTSRLELVPWSPADTDALARINMDPEVMRYVGTGRPATREESAAQSARFAAHWERFGFGLWALRPRGGGGTIGFAGLMHPLWLPGEEAEVEVGWRLARDAWGHGYATEAGRAALEHAFGVLELRHVVSYIAIENLRSQRVAERLGMHLDRAVVQPGRMRDLLVWQIRADRPRSAAA